MASIPMDQSGNRRSGGKNADRLPVSAHPAFPAIVALWFAALLGLGSLILPVQLIESMLTTTGIASAIPSAAPPLGFTARAAIALVATVGGALLGLFAARKVSQAASQPRASASERPGERQSDYDDDGFDADFDDDGLDADLPPLRATPETAPANLGRRRSLAMAEEARPSDFLNIVPLPGDDAEAEDALELGLEYAPDEEDAEGEYEAVVLDKLPSAPAMQLREEFIPAPAESGMEESRVEIRHSRAFAAPVGDALPFSPPSLARIADYVPPSEPAPSVADAYADPSVDDELYAADLPQPETTPENFVEIVTHDQVFTPEETTAVSNSEVTGLVQLVQKLGHTLEKHREWTAQRAASAAIVAGSESVSAAEPTRLAEVAQPLAEFSGEFEPAPADDAAEAMAAWFGKSSAAAEAQSLAEATPEPAPAAAPVAESVAPQAYAPFAGMGRLTVVDDAADDEDDDDEIEELAASFRLPVGNLQSPAAPQRDASYGSLAAANPFRRSDEEFVRIDESETDAEFVRPTVIFPSEEPARAAVPAPAVSTRPFDRPFDAPGSAPAPAPVAQIHPDPQPAPAVGRPASNDDSERALREALMNLQRMGK